jgi:hypothetical protein
MRSRPLFAMVALAVTVAPLWAQPYELRGTWSGTWIPADGIRDSITVRFHRDADELSGEILSPENLALETLSFDNETGRVVAEAKGSQGDIQIEAQIEEETRLNGTITYGNDGGVLRLTKWTYRP